MGKFVGIVSLIILFMLVGLILTKCFGQRKVQVNVKHFVYFGDGSYSEYQTRKEAMDKVVEVHKEAGKIKSNLLDKNMRKSRVRFEYHKADLMQHTHYSNEPPL